MTPQDIYLLSPELTTAGLAILLLILDLVIPRKGSLPVIALSGLAIPLIFSLALWLGLNGTGPSVQNTGILANTLVVDQFSLFFKFLFIGVAATIVLVSKEYSRKFDQFQGEYYSLLLLSVTGMMLLASSIELVTIYISLELTALPIAALAAFLRSSRSSESGMKFLILSGISSALLLYGMVMIYGFTGSTMLTDIADRLINVGLNADIPFGSYALLMGIVLIISGFGFKIAAVPFQMWAPDVYEGAPTPITAFLSVASKAAGFAVILRVFYIGLNVDTSTIHLAVEWGHIFAVLATLSMTLGNLVAISQKNIKRMLAYSTVAHAGYLMIGLAAVASSGSANEAAQGTSSVLAYLGGYALTNLAAFSAVIAISNRIGSDTIDDYAGMGSRSPYMSAILAFAMISLTGIPPTVGFMVKLYIFGIAINSGLAWLVLVGVINSVLSAYYYLRVVKVMYMSPSHSKEPISSGVSLRLALLATGGGVVILGLYPRPLLEIAITAAKALASIS